MFHCKKKFSIKYFFGKCDKIRRKLRIWSYLLKKSLMENFNFCAVVKLHTVFIILHTVFRVQSDTIIEFFLSNIYSLNKS